MAQRAMKVFLALGAIILVLGLAYMALREPSPDRSNPLIAGLEATLFDYPSHNKNGVLDVADVVRKHIPIGTEADDAQKTLRQAGFSVHVFFNRPDLSAGPVVVAVIRSGYRTPLFSYHAFDVILEIDKGRVTSIRAYLTTDSL